MSDLDLARKPLPEATASVSGIVNGGTVPGSVSGAAVAAGYIGEKLEASLGNSAISASNTPVNAGSLTLTPGIWIVYFKASVTWGSLTSPTRFQASVSTTSASHHDQSAVRDLTTSVSADHWFMSSPRYFNVSTNTTVYGVVDVGYSSASGLTTHGAASSMYAIRIA